ncbi:MAG: 4Fe-4S dicluster domain-containing protein [Methanocellales archaeon]
MTLVLSSAKIQSSEIKKIEELSGQNIFACYQCGKCSAGCPMVIIGTLGCHQVIRLLQLGQIEEALNSKIIWLCASCYTCETRCPKGVNLPRVMEALRQHRLRRNIDVVDITKAPVLEEKLPQIALVSCFRKFTR